MDIPEVVREIVADELERERVVREIKSEMQRVGEIPTRDEEDRMRDFLAALDSAKTPEEAAVVASTLARL